MNDLFYFINFENEVLLRTKKLFVGGVFACVFLCVVVVMFVCLFVFPFWHLLRKNLNLYKIFFITYCSC